MEVHLTNMKQGLAQSGRQGGDVLSLGLSPGGTLSSGPPKMPSWPSQLDGRVGDKAACSLTPEAC